MKKLNISKSTLITAIMLTASLLLSGCTEGNAEFVGGGGSGGAAVTETNISKTAAAEAAAATAETIATTPAETVTAETSEPVTSAAETSFSAAETAKPTEKITEAPAATPTVTAAPAPVWTETKTSGTMYINTDGVYSRKEAIQGSTKVKRYSLNEAVTVTAKTDTSYYKLSDGAFVHADYLSSNKVSVTTTTTAAAPAKPAVITTATQSKPTEQDRSYLNLSDSDVKYILNECEKYAKSLGFTVMSKAEYQKKVDELDRAFYELKDTDEGYQKYVSMCQEFEALQKYITNCDEKDFWHGDWHYIMYAGDFTGGEYTHSVNGYDTHCDTKEQSIEWVIRFLKSWIEYEHNEGRSCSTAGTRLKTFDNIAKEKGDWGVVSYDDIHSEYSTYIVFDMDTSYAFAVKFY